MFVAGLVDEILRSFDQTRRRQQQRQLQSPEETYQSFVERQTQVWTPPDLFDKCCARWLDGGCFDHHGSEDGNSRDRNHRTSVSMGSLDSFNHHLATRGLTTVQRSSLSNSSPTLSLTTVGHMGNGGNHHHQYHPRRLKNGKWACNGGCNKLHPTVTLFFDSSTHKTLAVLSCRLDPFVKYFDTLVDLQMAICKTPYLYVLDGFVRENWSYLTRLHNSSMTMMEKCDRNGYNDDEEHIGSRRPIPTFGSHLVTVALGALEQSDQVQRQVLEKERQCRQHRTTRQHQNTSSTDHDIVNDKQQPSPLFEDVLDICILNGLEEHLDVLTLHCLQRTNQKFRSIATSIIRKRLATTQIVVSPLVDGFYVSGYSVFRRSNEDRNDNDDDNYDDMTSRPTVMERQHGGRMVEYAMCRPIICKNVEDDEEGKGKDPDYEIDLFNGPPGSVENEESLRHRKTNEMTRCYLPKVGEDHFDWSCEELSFANLEREWGDICVHEYVGQNIIVNWRRSKVDTLVDPHHDTTTPAIPTSNRDLPIFNVRLSSSKKGPIRTEIFSIPHCKLTIGIEQMDATQVDDVTVRFGGRARIVGCEVDFLCLVSMYARSLEPILLSQFRETEKTRPLLQYESNFFQYVQNVARKC